MVEALAPYLLAFAGTLVSVGLKGFQHKNVIKDSRRLMFFTSYAMAFMDVLLIGLIVRSDWSIAFASGTGAALGMLLSTRMHDRFVASRKE